MHLRGVIYGGQAHFTCRFFDRVSTAWFHDGISTGSSRRLKGNLREVTDLMTLHRCGEKIAVAAVYAKEV